MSRTGLVDPWCLLPLTMCVHSSLGCSPASVCDTVNGPLAKAGAAATCGAKRPSGFTPLPKKGRYVIIELSSSVKGAKSQLAASEVVVFGRGELPRAREGPAGQGTAALDVAARVHISAARRVH